MRTRVILQLASTLPLVVTVAALGSASSGTATSEASALWELDPFELSHAWTLHEGKHWQITSSVYEDPGVTDATEGTRGTCR